MGHDVAISSISGMVGQHARWEGLPVLPSGYTTYSNDVVAGHARGFFGRGPGLVLVLYDAWAIDAQALEGLACAVWAPVHSRPVSGGDRLFYALSGAQPIAMSRYGEEQLTAAGLRPVYVPHAADTTVYRPLTDGERARARAAIGVPPGAFLIVINAANKGDNPPRKAWGEQLAAFAAFRARHDDAVLYIHSQATSPAGINLHAIVRDLDLGESVRFSPAYPQVTGLYPDEWMAGLMGCADVLSNPSYGEGFGLAALEAQACGTPVVLADNSAQTELCGAGWLAACQPYWNPQENAWWHVPLIAGIVKAWEKAYKRRGDARLREKAREFALRYDADLVAAQHWKPLLEMLEQYAGAVPVRLPGRNGGTVPLPTAEADGLTWIIRGHHTGDGLAIAHEDALKPVFDGLLPAGGVFLDVGAHVGRWSLRMARKASRVIAVEANPVTAAVLRAHIELNHAANVDVVEAAAWDSDALLNLDDPNRQVNGGSTRVVAGETAEDGTVVAVRLDDRLGGEPRIDLVKLDVEGADLHALRGLAGTLARCKPALIVERHDIYGYYELGDLTGLLESLGYAWRDESFTLPDGGQAPYLICEPREDDDD